MCLVPSDNLCSTCKIPQIIETLQINFTPSQPTRLLAHAGPWQLSARSFRFSPPHCYQLSQAGTSTLLRDHLPPHIASVSLEFPLELPYPPKKRNNMRLPRLRRVPCEQSHPQSRYGADQVLGFALFCTLTLPYRRIRFTCAMYRSLPIASFRPCRCQQRPCDSDCLPPGRGDACVPQAGFARHAGQTKKGFAGKTRKPLTFLVGMRGFEPPTPCSRSMCSTRLSHIPTAYPPPAPAACRLALPGWSICTQRILPRQLKRRQATTGGGSLPFTRKGR